MEKILGVNGYHELFNKMMCAEPSDNCKLNQCKRCPGKHEMEKYLGAILEVNEIENVPIQQWINISGKNIIWILQLT